MILRCKNKSSVELNVGWVEATSFQVNWFPFNRSWGELIFHKHSLDGVEGLLEEGTRNHFWKRSADLADTEAREHRSKSRSPRHAEPLAPLVQTSHSSLEHPCISAREMPLLPEGTGGLQKCFYINLERRPDRQRFLLAELATLGIPSSSISRIEAVDAEQSAGTPADCCTRSHIMALKQAMHEHLDAVLILEDDFE